MNSQVRGLDNKFYNIVRSDEPFHLDDIPLILKDNAAQMPYTREKSVAPNKGQRKLWAAKSRFLLWVRSQIGDRKARIIYVGAAPGVSIPYVDETVKGSEWITEWTLWDPVSFRKELTLSDRYYCNQDFFTNEAALQYTRSYSNDRNEAVIYIDDIRLAPPEDMDKKSKEFHVLSDKLIWENIQSTIEWMRIIRPNFWMTKYRTPYQPVYVPEKVESIQYPPGTTYFECWNGSGSTETRKWGMLSDLERFFENPQSKEFCVTFEGHEQRMQYYNAVQRPEYYKHNIQFPGLCHCLDCCNELDLHRLIIQNRKNDLTPISCADIIREIEALDEHMPHDSQLLDKKSPHGMYPDISPKDLKMLPEFQKQQNKYQKFKEDRKDRRRNDLVKKAPAELTGGSEKTCQACRKKFIARNPKYRFCISCNKK